MRFWDTSAILPLCIQESQTPTMLRPRQDDPGIVVWWATRVEGVSAVQRLLRMRQIDAAARTVFLDRLEALWPSVDQIAPTDEVRTRAEQLLARHPLRAADALQLGAALVWARDQPVRRDFVCLDDRLRDAAGREGFTVLP